MPKESSSVSAAYLRRIADKIAQAQIYPQQAKRKGWEDTLVIELELAPSGKILKMNVIQASRYQILNTAALQTVKRAQPLPAFDKEMTAKTLTVRIPFHYTLQDRK